MYGARDFVTEDIGDIIDECFNEIFQQPRDAPEVLAAQRIGPHTDGRTRPIKVTLPCSESVKYVISRTNKLKKARDSPSKIYLAPDRNKEERNAYHQLVVEMKKLTAEKPAMHHLIRNRKVISVKKT